MSFYKNLPNISSPFITARSKPAGQLWGVSAAWAKCRISSVGLRGTSACTWRVKCTAILLRETEVAIWFNRNSRMKCKNWTKLWNHAVIPARAAHFHGAVSPRLVPIKQLGGGSPPEDSQQLCHGRVWGRLDRQAGYSQAASLGLLLPTSAHPDRSNRQLRSTKTT